jgi:hypothetical protein
MPPGGVEREQDVQIANEQVQQEQDGFSPL